MLPPYTASPPVPAQYNNYPVYGQPPPQPAEGYYQPQAYYYPQQQGSYPPAPKQGYAAQGHQRQGYPPPQGNLPPQRYPPPQGYPPQGGYPPPQGYPPTQGGYPTPQRFPPPGFPPPGHPSKQPPYTARPPLSPSPPEQQKNRRKSDLSPNSNNKPEVKSPPKVETRHKVTVSPQVVLESDSESITMNSATKEGQRAKVLKQKSSLGKSADLSVSEKLNAIKDLIPTCSTTEILLELKQHNFSIRETIDALVDKLICKAAQNDECQKLTAISMAYVQKTQSKILAGNGGAAHGANIPIGSFFESVAVHEQKQNTNKLRPPPKYNNNLAPPAPPNMPPKVPHNVKLPKLNPNVETAPLTAEEMAAAGLMAPKPSPVTTQKPQKIIAEVVDSDEENVEAVKPWRPAPTVSAHPDAELIRPSGKRRALLIGINYYGSKKELNGCVQDVGRIRKLVSQMYGFLDIPSCMTVLTDAPDGDPRLRPTRRNIILAMGWLVEDTMPGDILFFHFSGHGSQKRDLSGTEIDGFDETILPTDHKTAGQITDDDIFNVMIRPLKSGVKLVAFMDCCHSGTGMDLSFNWDRDSITWQQELYPKFSAGDVQLFSGCQDDQTSADVMVPSWGSGGAVTLAIVTALSQKPQGWSYKELLDKIYSSLKQRGFQQHPQLSSSQRFDTGKTFNLNEIFPNTNKMLGQDPQGRNVRAKHQARPARAPPQGLAGVPAAKQQPPPKNVNNNNNNNNGAPPPNIYGGLQMLREKLDGYVARQLPQQRN